MKIEVTKPIQLDDEQASLLDNHSLLNILTILISEIQLSSMLVHAETFADPLLHRAHGFKDKLKNRVSSSDEITDLEMFSSEADTFYNIIRSYSAIDEETRFVLKESHENVNRILYVFKKRIIELLNRPENWDSWVPMKIQDLKLNFREVLQAIAQNSKGKYNIVQNIARKTNMDYIVNLSIEGSDSDTILMPPVLQDCFRDLIANARKYTKPGGSIQAGLYNNGESISIVVSDDGCGIPVDELNNVVNFGYRASNVAYRPTKGGGFGLTKAYLVTKQFHGRMWIESEVNKGTTITIRIPVPLALIEGKRETDFSSLLAS